MWRRVVVLCVALAAAASAAHAGVLQGSWTARSESDRTDRLYLSLETDRHHQHGSDVDPRDLKGLKPADITSDTRVPVRFTLEREAGTVEFEGEFRDGRGAGEFTFTPDPEYRERLRSLGLRPRRVSGEEDRDLFELTLLDVSTDFIRSMQKAGYDDEALDKYVAFRIFGIDPAYVREMASLGFDHLSANKLTETRIHGVTPDYIRSMRAAGEDLTLDEYIQSRIFGISPEFTAEMERAGYPDLGRNMLLNFRIHGVTPEFIASLRDAGYAHVPASKLVEMRIFNVTPEFIRRANRAAGRRLPVSKLVEMRIFHVDPDLAGSSIDD
jgi:hypothetical protein